MAEDIPEEQEFLPDLLPAVPEPPNPPRKPDYGLFLALISLLLGILIPVLQTNGLEINWGWSAVAYLGIVLGVVWTFLTHAAPHRGIPFRVIGSLVIVAVLLPLASMGIRRQYHKEHSPPPTPPTDAKVLAAVNGIGGSVSDLRNVLATNQSDPRLAILASNLKDAVQEGEQIKKGYVIVDINSVDLKTIRENRTNDLALLENQKKQAEIQRQIDEHNAKLRSDSDKEREARWQREADQDLFQKEKSLATKILPVFDYVIEKLDRELAGVARDAGESRTSDILGTPTVYSSALVKDGVIVSGTNFLRIGTNSAWSFEISTTVEPHLHEYQPININQISASINIVSRTTNGESVLTVTPRVEQIPVVVGHSRMSGDVIEWRQVVRAAIKLNVPNGLTMNEQSVDNYTNEIDKAIIQLIGAQDQQCPLPSKSN